jgi:hypothetical protein
MAEGQSPLDGILEENAAKEQEAKPLGKASSNHKPSTPDEPGASGSSIRQIRDIQASDAQYLANRIKQVEAMVMALRAIVGVTALIGAYTLWKVRKFDSMLDPKKALKKGNIIEVETSTSTPAVEVPEVPS